MDAAKDSNATASRTTPGAAPGIDRLRVQAAVERLRPPTPARRLGSHYAVVTEAALLDLRDSPNAARVFVLLASGWRRYRTCRRSGGRRGGPLAFGFRDLAGWTGHCGRTLEAHLAALAGRGYVRTDGRGRYRVTGKGVRRTSRDGRFVRLPIARVPRMTGRETLVYWTAAMSTTRRGRRLVRWREVADVLGVCERTAYRAIAGLRRLGVVLHRLAFRGPEKSVRSTWKKVSGARSPTGPALGKGAKTGGSHPIQRVEMPRPPSAAAFAARRAELKAQAEALLQQARAT